MQRRIELEPDLQVGSLIRIKFVHFYTGNSAELRNDSRLFGLVEFAGVRKRNTIGYVKNHWCKVNKSDLRKRPKCCTEQHGTRSLGQRSAGRDSRESERLTAEVTSTYSNCGANRTVKSTSSVFRFSSLLPFRSDPILVSYDRRPGTSYILIRTGST